MSEAKQTPRAMHIYDGGQLVGVNGNVWLKDNVFGSYCLAKIQNERWWDAPAPSTPQGWFWVIAAPNLYHVGEAATFAEAQAGLNMALKELVDDRTTQADI